MKRPLPFRPRVEALEGRSLPATAGIPWTDPTHLTLSFAPDGSPIAGHTSDLFAALGAAMAPAIWQEALLRAAQTWAVQANLNFGLVPDLGQPFGSAGPTQGDGRFGDVRFAAQPMSGEVSAITVPHDPFLSGTLAGDVFFNSNVALAPASLQAVALHEIGHALGLDHSADPQSVMFAHFNRRTALAASDVAAVRALYGLRTADGNELQKSNDNVRSATNIKFSQVSNGYDGSTPLVIWGDLTTHRDVDFFYLKPLVGYEGSITFHLQTRALSLLQPRLALVNAAGAVLSETASTALGGAVLTLTIPHPLPDASYYVKVSAAAGDLFDIGRYALAVTFDARNAVPQAALDAVMRGPYDTLAPSEVQKLFTDPHSALLNDDAHTDDSFLTAVTLKSTAGYLPQAHYEALGSLADAADRDFYKVKTPKSGPGVLTAAVFAQAVNGVAPSVVIFDGNQNPVPATILANGNGAFRVQAANLKPGGNYFLEVAAPGRAGNYALVVDGLQPAAHPTTFLDGTLDAARPVAVFQLHVAQTQIFSWLLTTQSADPAAGVVMEVFNNQGLLASTLTAPANNTVSGLSDLLTPGTYTVRFRLLGAGSIRFTLRGDALTDPIGPVLDDPTLQPQFIYNDATVPVLFLYPGNVISSKPYQWVVAAAQATIA